MPRSMYFAGVCLMTLALCGCGDAKRLPTVKAGGKVTYEGGNAQPVTNVEIVLLPDNGGDYSPHGKLDAEGKFELSTYGENDGAPVGTYKAYFRAVMPELPKTPPGATGTPAASGPPAVVRIETIVPKEYTTPGKTPLTNVEIPKEGGELALTVKRPAGR